MERRSPIRSPLKTRPIFFFVWCFLMRRAMAIAERHPWSMYRYHPWKERWERWADWWHQKFLR